MAHSICEYANLQTAIGRIRVIECKGKVLSVEFHPAALETRRAAIERKLGAKIELVPSDSLRSARELEEYFSGKRRSFDVDVDFSLVSEFQREVLKKLRQVGYGKVVSYAELARRVGNPRASRAVGGAMRQNPIPIIVPCHRVTASNGGLGGFTGGLGTKQKLLELEGYRLGSGKERALNRPKRSARLVRSH